MFGFLRLGKLSFEANFTVSVLSCHVFIYQLRYRILGRLKGKTVYIFLYFRLGVLLKNSSFKNLIASKRPMYVIFLDKKFLKCFWLGDFRFLFFSPACNADLALGCKFREAPLRLCVRYSIPQHATLILGWVSNFVKLHFASVLDILFPSMQR